MPRCRLMGAAWWVLPDGCCPVGAARWVLQDRLKIAKGGIGPDVMLARQVVLNCGAFHGWARAGGACDDGAWGGVGSGWRCWCLC